MGKIKEVGKKVLETTKNVLDYHLNGNQEGVVFNDYAILRKPIGIASKSYGFMEAMIHRNIGSHQYEFDGYATLIGMNANPYLNSEVSPWFMLDKDKQTYDNYLSYVNKTYFHGTMLPPNFQRIADKIKLFDYNELIGENSYVGAIHHYDIDNILGARLLIPNGATNPNGYNDTKLGVINNFYLSSMLYASYDKMNSQWTSSYEQPSAGYEENVNVNSYSVTQGAYSEFGFKGRYGLNDNTFWSRTATVIPQNVLTDNVISSLEYNGLSRFLGSASESLYKASGGKNREFIMKSIYGVDLMFETPFLGNGDIDYNILKKRSKKKYYISIEDKDSAPQDYISQITYNNVNYESIVRDGVDNYVRFSLKNPGNDNYSTFGAFLAYAEKEGDAEGVPFTQINANSGIAYGKYEIYSNFGAKKDIISYTNEQFNKNRYKTIIGKFHTSKDENDKFSTAVSQYGMSRGRNLLKRNHKDQNTNGFEDPYCRVWTYHKQYSTYSNLIRPFINHDNDNQMANELDDKLEKTYQVNRKHLRNNSVINKDNRLLNIAPTTSGDPIYRCMFSIENLAWKGSNLFENTKYKKGPQKGRIMWFPPYGLTFNENVNTNWNATQFIGRGEKIYSYVDTERSGNLSFILLIDHPSIINSVPKATDTQGGVDDVESTEQALLRFFAGCEVLGDTKNNQNASKEKREQSTEPFVTTIEPIQDLSIKFNIYFPNNYSGMDDDPKTMVQYLINGLGPNLYNPHMQYKVNEENVGGYEIQNNKGISYITKWKNGTPSIPLFNAKDEDGNENVINGLLCDNINGRKNIWGYRVDENRENEVLENLNSYLDTKSFGLNRQYVNGSEVLCNFVDFATYMGHSEMGDNRVVSTLNSVLNTHKIKTIKLCGYSTISGKYASNVTLAKERANSVKKWLCTNIFLNLVNDIQITTQDNISVPIDDINSKESKENRKVSVEIILQSEDISNNTPDQAFMGNMTPFLENHYTQEEGSIDTTQTQTKTSTESDIVEIKNEYNEFDFFQEISVNNPFLRNKIVDKIKYFDPAFHSITPEGFNSRLTFLHQCTRQGATNSASESNGNNVRNLGFGAPPICVLRIGDFFNTKIIINSLNITYDETCWDMNDEGIGVMPMMAKVDISFHFLGGSDLSGPISRLQNAVSFNYYANTSVYDTVADMNNDKINNSEDNGNTK